MTYGDVLRTIRTDLGMSQKEFAKYCFTPVKTLQNWEQGERSVPKNFIMLLTYKLSEDGYSASDYVKTIKKASPEKRKRNSRLH